MIATIRRRVGTDDGNHSTVALVLEVGCPCIITGTIALGRNAPEALVAAITDSVVTALVDSSRRLEGRYSEPAVAAWPQVSARPPERRRIGEPNEEEPT